MTFNIGILLVRIVLNFVFDYEAFKWKPGMPLSAAIGVFVHWYSDFNTLGLAAFSLYLSILKGIHFLEQDYVLEFTEKIERKSRIVTPLQVYVKIQKFLDIKNNLCQSLSFIPCIVFGVTFFRASVDIIGLQTEPSMVSILSIVFFVTWFIQVIIITLISSSGSYHSERLLMSLENKIVTTVDDLHAWSHTLKKIREAKAYKYRAYDLFPITRKVLLSFISSLLTFTVLFIQMASRLMDNRKI
jgi:hypothetical protein